MMLGMVSVECGVDVSGDFEDGFDNAFSVRNLLFFEGHTVNLGCVDGGYALDGCVKEVKSLFLDDEADLGADSTEGFVLLNALRLRTLKKQRGQVPPR